MCHSTLGWIVIKKKDKKKKIAAAVMSRPLSSSLFLSSLELSDRISEAKKPLKSTEWVPIAERLTGAFV